MAEDEALKKAAAAAQAKYDAQSTEAVRLDEVEHQRHIELYRAALAAFSAPVDMYIRRGTGDLRSTAHEFAAMYAKVGMFKEAEHLLASVNAYLQFRDNHRSPYYKHTFLDAMVDRMHAEAEAAPAYLREA